ncbi:MAG: response regulator [Bacteroidota bacterium]
MENKISILHLEDQVADSILIKSMISKWFSSFDYHFVDDEASFVKALEEKKIDVILSDFELPDYSGSDALLLVRKQYPHIPFIFVTGKMGEDSAIESLLNGATDYVMKSKPERLVPAIKRVLYEAELLKDRIASDKALRESEEKFRNLVENISDVIFEVDKQWQIQYISPVIEKIMGFKPQELIGAYFINIVYEPDKNSFSERFSELNEKVETAQEFRCTTKTGDICWVRTSVKANFDADGFIGGSGTLIDITKRKQNEEALFKEQYLMEILMNIIPDHLYFKDLDSKFIRISKSNNPAFRITDSSEAIGKTDFDFFTEEHAHAAYLDEQEIIRTGKTMIKEEKETWPDAPDTWVFSTKMPLRDLDGNIVGTFGISRDITERKQFEEELLKAKEKAEASDRLKTVFMRNISHEIRTPLNGILGFGQLMSEPNLSQEEKEEFLIMVNESSDRLMNTVTNIMENSLIVSGNQEVQKKEIILDALLDEIYNKFNNRCAQKRLTFLIQKQKTVDELIIDSDPELLNKVLYHLIDNAIKYTTTGFIAVGYNLMANQILFFVKDSGIGINQDQQQRIFDHFIQGDDSYTRDQEGNGLGLSIAKGLVELLGGRIWVESVRGEGSSFFFTIPTEITGTLKTDIQTITESVKLKPLILIADDEETNSLLLERMLRKEGLDMLVVSDGLQTVEACKNNPLISMVLMDLKMPVLDGFEATKMIKAFRPDLPIIALSAFALSGDERRALAAGCNEYMTKPLRKDLVMRKLRQYGVVE